MTAERWQRILRVMDEAYADYLTGMTALRKRVVMDLRCKLSNGSVCNRPDLDQPSPRDRPALTVRHRRARGRREHTAGQKPGYSLHCTGVYGSIKRPVRRVK